MWIFSCFPQRPQSKLRKEFSFSVRFIENGAGRSRNQFHRIRIFQLKEKKKKKKVKKNKIIIY